MLSHFNLVNNARLCAGVFEIGKDDIVNIPLPLFHCFAMVAGSLCSHSVGANCVYPHPAYSGIATLKTMAEDNCTTLLGVPAMFADVCREQATHKLPLPHAVRGAVGGAMLDPELLKLVEK